MAAKFVQGYPQPAADYAYTAITYSGRHCKCGIDLRQVAPFQLKSEPKWGRNLIMQVNWVHDEYFTTPDVWQRVFHPYGIESRVVTDRKGRVLETVVHLVFEEEVSIDASQLEIAQVCRLCGGTKFRGVVRGYIPALQSVPREHGFKSKEVFGENLEAFRQVIVSQSVRRALQENQVRGVSFVPIAQ